MTSDKIKNKYVIWLVASTLSVCASKSLGLSTFLPAPTPLSPGEDTIQPIFISSLEWCVNTTRMLCPYISGFRLNLDIVFLCIKTCAHRENLSTPRENIENMPRRVHIFGIAWFQGTFLCIFFFIQNKTVEVQKFQSNFFTP